MKTALIALITGDDEYKIHHRTLQALSAVGYIHERMATDEGIRQSGLPYDKVHLMILGADVSYGNVTLPKGLEVMVTWRTREKNGKKREYVTGYIMNGGNLAEVRLYVTPRHTFEIRLTPRLTEPTIP